MSGSSQQYSEDDGKELERLIGLVSSDRPQVKQLLEAQLVTVKATLKQAGPPIETPKPTSVTTTTSQQPASDVHYETIANYAWDNQDKVVKLYVELADVGTLHKDKITATLLKGIEGGQDLVLLVHGLKDKNYRLRITHLFGKVASVSINQRAQRLVISLHKDGSTHWSSLVSKDKSQEKSKDPIADNSDPSSGIMDMMKKLYDDGDEEMKRTIAKAWSETRKEKPMF